MTTFIVLLFHFCTIYFKKNLIFVYNSQSRHLNQKGKKKVRKVQTTERESWAEKRKKKKKEERRRRKKEEEEEEEEKES